MAIPQPMSTKGLKWAPTFAMRWTEKFSQAQKFIDSEVLRYSAPLTPRLTGFLINSGSLGTTIGSGLVQYTAPYAASQYYDTSESRAYDPHRGAKWFERMKTAYKDAILAGAKKLM